MESQDDRPDAIEETIKAGSFFQKALALIKPAPYKLIVVLAFALLLAAQAVRGYENPTLALSIIVTAIVIFAVSVIALEFRDRQLTELVRENDRLKEQIRELALEKQILKRKRAPALKGNGEPKGIGRTPNRLT